MKTTKETDKMLASSDIELNQYLSGDYLNEYKSLHDYLGKYIEDHNLKTTDIVKDSLLDRGYVYQILNGTRPNPHRDKLIPICLAMKMSLEETNRALKIGKSGTLYSKDGRDAVIIYCINKKIFDVSKVNELLYDNSFELLGGMK